jgi:hypothetical protein
MTPDEREISELRERVGVLHFAVVSLFMAESVATKGFRRPVEDVFQEDVGHSPVVSAPLDQAIRSFAAQVVAQLRQGKLEA